MERAVDLGHSRQVVVAAFAAPLTKPLLVRNSEMQLLQSAFGSPNEELVSMGFNQWSAK